MAKNSRPRGPKSDKIWSDAIRRAVHRVEINDKGEPVKRLELLADQVVKAAIGGDMTAAREIGDRLDGKPHQTVDTSAEVDVYHHDVEGAADEFARLVADRAARAGQGGDPRKPH